jgi:hypothetical protein
MCDVLSTKEKNRPGDKIEWWWRVGVKGVESCFERGGWGGQPV